MIEDFKGYYKPSKQEFQDLWNKGIFVLDTSVILGLYRYPAQALDDFLQTLKQISTRLWLPHQIALEYQANRLTTIAEQVNKFAEVKKILRESKETLFGKLNDLQLRKRHSAINPDKFLQKVDTVFIDFENDLNNLCEKQPDTSDEDKIREEIDALFKGRIGAPFTSTELNDLYNAGKGRYERQQPPGYLDKEKSKTDNKFHFYNGLVLEREYGDLIIWHQIIKEAKDRELKYLIFITDDEKEDWWWIHKGKIIGPRPELIEEICSQSSISAFYMYNSSRFLAYAQEFLGAKINQESINQVHEISQIRKEELRRSSVRSKELLVLDAVNHWLSNIQHPEGRINFGQRYPDFLVEDNNNIIGYEVKRLYNANLLKKHLDNWIAQYLLGTKRQKLSLVNFVIVVNDEPDAKKVLKALESRHLISIDSLHFIVGFISTYSEKLDMRIFIPVGEIPC